MANGADFFRKWCALSMWFDRASSSWKTPQQSLFEDSNTSSPNLTRSGMTSDGQCWAQPMSVRLTRGTDGGVSQPGELFPTITKGEAGHDGPNNIHGNGTLKLTSYVHRFPTPTVQDSKNDAPPSQWRRNSLPLNVVAAMFPTPAASDATRGGAEITPNMTGQSLRQSAGGKLNPMWVAWLMGIPLGWTKLPPSVTAKYLSARRRRGTPSAGQSTGSTDDVVASLEGNR